MKPAHATPRAREDLDRKFKRWTRAARDRPPVRGWIRDIREALGMSAEQLGKRLGISRAAATALEKSEVEGTVRIATLQKAAAALDCSLVYALVPKRPLLDILRRRAYGIVMPEVLLVMHKEKMKVTDEVLNAMIKKIIEQRKLLLKPRLLWNETALPKEYGPERKAEKRNIADL